MLCWMKVGRCIVTWIDVVDFGAAVDRQGSQVHNTVIHDGLIVKRFQ